jgi:hypothetical protein
MENLLFPAAAAAIFVMAERDQSYKIASPSNLCVPLAL